VQAVHIKCNRDGRGFRGMTDVRDGVFRSEDWAFEPGEVDLLRSDDTWVYFHPSKGVLSARGGIVTRIDHIPVSGGKDRIAFEVAERQECAGREWRGQNHRNAWTGGIVAADFPHESE
jgi:hypothetical protein